MNPASSSLRHYCRSSIAFAGACAILFAVLCLAVPNYFPLMEPDSSGYVSFSANRTAMYPLFLRALTGLGLSLQSVTYVQVAVFCGALVILIVALDRANIRRFWLVLFVVLLGTNSYFASFQRTILTESIGFSAITAATAFLLDYLRTGRAIRLALAGIFVGLSIGIRPGCITFLPMLVLAVWLKWHRRDVTAYALVAALIVPTALGMIAERAMHRMEHGARADSVLPYILTGKAAMLVRSDTVFTGPASATLNSLGQKLSRAYEPVHDYLSRLPSRVAVPVMTAFFEAAGQFQVINKDLASIAVQSGVSEDYLREELGKQAIRSNIGGYATLTLTHYFGQWSIAALTFPPTARAVNDFSSSLPKVPLIEEIGPTPFFPVASLKSVVVYPGFLIAGAVTLVLSLFLLRYLWRPTTADVVWHNDLMIAAFFALTCHSSMFLISLINVSTPRFLMMVYPHILLAALFMLRALCPAWVAASPLRRPGPH